MDGYYLFISAACILLCSGAVVGWEDMCGDIQKTLTQSVSLSHSAYPDNTDRKHCQCNVTTDYNADIMMKLQLHREGFEPQDDSGCSPRLMLAVVDREMQESRILRGPQRQDFPQEGVLRPSVGVCPMPHFGPSTATRSYVTMQSSQKLTVTFQNPSAHKTKFYINLSVNPSQRLRVKCGALVIPPPVLMEGGALIPVHKKGSEIGAIVACVIIAAFIIAIFIIAYCKVKIRDRNRQNGTQNSNPKRRSVNDGKNPKDKAGRGNLGYEGTPRSSAGDVSFKNRPNDLNGHWQHPKGTDGVDNDLIPHDFLRRIAKQNPNSNGSSPRHVMGYHGEPASYPVRAHPQPHILPPTSAMRQPGFPHQPIMDPIFADTPDRDPRSPLPRGQRVSFPEPDTDSFDSPYTKPVPGSPSINAPSDSGYTGSDIRPNNEDTTSEISGPDDRPILSPNGSRPTSGDRNFTPDNLQKYPIRSNTPDDLRKPYNPYAKPEYANLGFDPQEVEPPTNKSQPNIPNRASPFPIKEYPQSVIPMEQYPVQSAPPPVKEYPEVPDGYLPRKGVSPAPVGQLPHNVDPEPTKQAPKKKKKKGPKKGIPEEPVKPQSPQVPMYSQSPHVPMHPQSPQVPSHPQSPQSFRDDPTSPVHYTPTPTPPVERDFTPDPIQQVRPISPDPASTCTSPASMISGSRTPMGRSPFPGGAQSPLIPPLGIDNEPYIPPSPWRMPYIYKQEPLMYIDDTDSESVVSSMSTRDLYVRTHKELNADGSVTPVLRDPYRPSYQRPVGHQQPATISETDV